MDFQIDESRMLYSLGAFLGIITILYFGQEIILNLSPTIKSFILFSATAVFLGGAEYIDRGLFRSSLYVFSAFSYLSFLVYIFARFNFSSEATFLILAASSAGFTALGFLKSEKGYELDRGQAKKMVGVIIALVAVVVVFDVLGSQPEYSLELRDTVQIEEGEEVRFGELVVRNDFLLSRNVDIPDYRGCLFPSERYDRGLYFSPEDRGIIAGDTTLRLDLNETVRVRPERNISISGSYTVRHGECPENPENYTVYIQESDGRSVLSVD